MQAKNPPFKMAPRTTVFAAHPAGKRGRNIDPWKYLVMKRSILKNLRTQRTHSELHERVKDDLGRGFPGSVSWYMETVKLDLEAKKFIRRVTAGGKIYYARIRRKARSEKTGRSSP